MVYLKYHQTETSKRVNDISKYFAGYFCLRFRFIEAVDNYEKCKIITVKFYKKKNKPKSQAKITCKVFRDIVNTFA
jgi:hypothetical protein